MHRRTISRPSASTESGSLGSCSPSPKFSIFLPHPRAWQGHGVPRPPQQRVKLVGIRQCARAKGFDRAHAGFRGNLQATFYSGAAPSRLGISHPQNVSPHRSSERSVRTPPSLHPPPERISSDPDALFHAMARKACRCSASFSPGNTRARPRTSSRKVRRTLVLFANIATTASLADTGSPQYASGLTPGLVWKGSNPSAHAKGCANHVPKHARPARARSCAGA